MPRAAASGRSATASYQGQPSISAASPATGSHKVHQTEEAELVGHALGR